MAAAANTNSLFAELEKLCHQGNHEAVLKQCDKILKLLPDDRDVVHVKSITLIHLDQHQAAIDLLSSTSHSDLLDALLYERAYCLYRLSSLEESLDLVRSFSAKDGSPDQFNHFRHLEGQILFKLERYAEALELYPEIVSATEESDPYYQEVLSNLAAVEAATAIAASSDSCEPGPSQYQEVSEKSIYELSFNQACKSIASGDYDDAERRLVSARAQCRKSLQDEDYSEEEIEREISPIALQLACVYQLQGRTEEASEIYTGILKSDIDDVAVIAIASNNMMAIKKDHDLFESSKLYKQTTAPALKAKFTSPQKEIVAMNGALLSLHMKKTAAARDSARALSDEFPENATPLLILASISLLEKKDAHALEDLKGFCAKLDSNVELHLCLAQLQIQAGLYQEALETLEGLYSRTSNPVRYQPGLVSLMVWLYGQISNHGKAVTLLERATEYWKKTSGKLTNDSALLRQFADFKLRSNNVEEAAKDYERLVKQNPQDIESVAKLIICYSQFNVGLAQKYQSYLPEASYDATVVDVEALEAQFGQKKASGSGAAANVEKIKMRRKRKPMMPKNYDPNVTPDPERWLPKRERTTFVRKGKAKKELGKGPQGVNMEGGGIGGTGSANIGGKYKSADKTKPEPVPEPVAEPVAEAAAVKPAQKSSQNEGGSSKKKKKGRK
ncbi:uncharacterized protein BJ171DRAFT_497988 [Polychytrium aggregatum]|uniref:uncharacterized protein n=1 Tax=Polychytrium aggregatum TaxID=110093 RepID=UPI0022FE4E7F|nr:uncharacterized protein BJ171DRAFT_497988 [Polychytrium aggregatum]KAI9206477.1 hypothetical protein BJ171DRAFT_497988 [Polychytrium aggregatum]